MGSQEEILIIYNEVYQEQVNSLKNFREGPNYGQNFSVTLKKVSTDNESEYFEDFNSLHDYIFNEFKSNSTYTLKKYVLLVGSTEEVPTYWRDGIDESSFVNLNDEDRTNFYIYSAASDISYGFRDYDVSNDAGNLEKLANYELIVGRLSSGDKFYHTSNVPLTDTERQANITNQVDKIIEYETLIHQIKTNSSNIDLTDDNIRKVIGIASNEGSGLGIDGLPDNEFLRNELEKMRSSALNMKYTELYQGSLDEPINTIDGIEYDQGGEPYETQLAAEINQGSPLLLYAGHASEIQLTTTTFSTENVESLQNNNKYFLGCIVGCSLGSHDERYVTLAEHLQLVANKGSIAMFASSILQSWQPPMHMQRKLVENIIENNEIKTIGELFKESIVSPNFLSATDFWYYHILGDPATRYLL